MNVLFIHTPFNCKIQEFLGAHGPLLGFGSMAHHLQRAGHRVEILDCPTLGVSLPEAVKLVKRLDPEVVGVTSTTPSFYEACKLAEEIKRARPSCVVVMGGPHVSFMDNPTLRSLSVDVVVRGEGEVTMSELVSQLEEGSDLSEVPGITYRRRGRIMRNPDRPPIQDLDEIHVSYEKLPMHRYSFQGHDYATVVSSRGCPYRCVFCSSSLLHGKDWRRQSAKRVVEEIRFLVEEYGVRHVEFLDDLFTLDNRRVEEICQLLNRERLDVRWFCSSRVDTISKRLMASMRRAGCVGIYFGVESGCQRVLNSLKKGTRIRQAVEAFKGAKETGIDTVGSFILGIPGETVEDIRKTINFSKRLRPNYAQFTFCTPTQAPKFMGLQRLKTFC